MGIDHMPTANFCSPTDSICPNSIRVSVANIVGNNRVTTALNLNACSLVRLDRVIEQRLIGLDHIVDPVSDDCAVRWVQGVILSVDVNPNTNHMVNAAP